MFKGCNKILSIVLLIQVFAIITFCLIETNTSSEVSSSKLVSLNENEVSEIIISEEKNVLGVKKVSNNWVFKDKDILVNSEKAKKLVSKLLSLNRGMPVGKTKNAAKQLEASKEVFKKKVELVGKNGSSKIVYIGNVPSFKKVYVSLEGEDNTYSVSFDSFTLSAKEDDWYDDKLLTFDYQKIDKISFKDFVVTKNEGYLIEGLKENEELQTEKLNSFVQRIASLRYDSIPSIVIPDGFSEAKNQIEFSIVRGGDTIDYIVKGPIGEDVYYLKASNQKYYFKIHKALNDALLSQGRGSFIIEKAS